MDVITFARSVGILLLCLAHVTNTMDGVDFEKGDDDGTGTPSQYWKTLSQLCIPWNDSAAAQIAQDK